MRLVKLFDCMDLPGARTFSDFLRFLTLKMALISVLLI